MKRLIAMTARVPLTLDDGRTVAVGEGFAVTPIQAAALKYQRRAEFGAPAVAPPVPVVVPPPMAEPLEVKPARAKRTRTYRRRDMEAE